MNGNFDKNQSNFMDMENQCQDDLVKYCNYDCEAMKPEISLFWWYCS